MIRPWKAALLVAAMAFGPACKSDTASGGAPAPRPTEAGAPPEVDGKTPLPDPLPEVAATVNGKPIPTKPVKRLAEAALQSGTYPPDQKPLAYRRALGQFVVRELLLQEALARKVSPDEKQIAQMENAARSRYKDAAAFQQALAAEGMDEAWFKSEIRTQATTDALLQSLFKDMSPDSVSDADVKKFYDGNPAQFTSADRVRAAHILIRVPRDTAPNGKGPFRAKAEQALKEIKGGADFAKVAAKHSQDNSTKDRGGEMDPYGRGQMPPELGGLDQAVRTLGPGQVSEVVETPAGFHVVKLLERLPDETVPFDTVKEQVRQHLLNQKRQEAAQSFVNGLRAKAKIESHI